MFYADNITEETLDNYFIGNWEPRHFRWYCRIMERIGHDSSEYDFRYTHDLRLFAMMCSGDQSLTIQHEDETYLIFRSLDMGITVDIFLNKETGQHTAIEVYPDEENSINMEI